MMICYIILIINHKKNISNNKLLNTNYELHSYDENQVMNCLTDNAIPINLKNE